MATTTNYGWSTPDDVSLVKDGASAIRTLGSSADTTVKALNPGTTAGDIDYYTTSTAKARVAIGTAGQVLAVNSGATAPEWITSSSGGMTLLSTTTLSGATTTISGISGSYTNLLMFIFGVTNATASSRFNVLPNNVSNAYFVNNATGTALNLNNGDLELSGTGGTNGPLLTDADNVWTVQIDNYASSTARKSFQVYGQYMNAASTRRAFFSNGGLADSTAITSLVFYNNGGNLSTGTVLLYGVK
jgi:hypothetical protein